MAPPNKPNPPGWPSSGSKPAATLPNNAVPNTKRVDFRLEDFDLFIKQKGIRVKVYRSLLCPNVKSIDSAEHEIDCPLCLGMQFIDVNPIDCWAAPQSDDLKKKQFSEGLYDKNMITLTFERGIDLQYFTLVELCDFTDIFFERVKRQRGQTDVLKYKATCVNVLVDSEGKQHYNGQDFDLDPNGSIKWRVDKGPESGSIYSVHYHMRKQYRAVEAQHVDRYTQVLNKNNGGKIEMLKLYEEWKLQKEYFVERKDLKGNPLSPNLIRDEDED
jgi:hypothetical protein